MRATGHTRRRVYSDPILDLHPCKECGCSNPVQIGEEVPERCAMCGTVYERETVNKMCFAARMIRPGKEDGTIETKRVGGHSWKKPDDSVTAKLTQDMIEANETKNQGKKRWTDKKTAQGHRKR